MNDNFGKLPNGMPVSPEAHSGSNAGATGPGCTLKRAIYSFVACAVLVCSMTAGLFLTGCSSPAAPLPELKSGSAASGPVILGEGDVIKLSFADAPPAYSSSQKIRTDGKISLHEIGEIQAAGKTLSRLQSDISGRYASLLNNSRLVVTLEASGKPVIISGGIVSPGKFVFDRPTTLLEAIMGANGFTDFARKKKVQLIRVVRGQYQTATYDMSSGASGRQVPLVYVQPGDIIYVPVSNW